MLCDDIVGYRYFGRDFCLHHRSFKEEPCTKLKMYKERSFEMLSIYSPHFSCLRSLKCLRIQLLKFVILAMELTTFCEQGLRSKYSNSLRAGWFEDRIPVRDRFSSPILTDTGAYPTSYTTGTKFLFCG